jgi:hypothetical protein
VRSRGWCLLSLSASPSGENPVVVLLVLIIIVTVVSAGLFVEMYRRDQPMLGAAGLAGLMIAAVLGSVYGTLVSI